jgi:hypothetical protein
MLKSFRNKLYLLPIFSFLVIHLVWMFRAYYDVAYMDQMQILAGNMKNMLDGNTSLNDLYYRPPFLFIISNVLVFLNCKLFAYNTYIENVISGLILALIAFYFIKYYLNCFTPKVRLFFAGGACFIIFCFTKWELSLWSGGFSHYMVVLFSIICVGISHKYYFKWSDNGFINKNYLPIYIGLSVISILETTSYILPFLLALLIQLVLNYWLFREKINAKKWRIVLGTTIGLIIFSILINYLAEVYSIKHPYDTYGKVNIGSNLTNSLKKIFTEPMFVIKFFLIANAGNLMDKDYYPSAHYVMDLLPYLGLVILILYGYSIYLFIKRKKIEGIFAINLILSALIFYGFVLVGRMHFNDVYYGGSSRYSAQTFTGTLGVCTFFLLLLQQPKNLKLSQKILYVIPLLFIGICNLVVDRNEWRLAPYRRVYGINMSDNLKLNTNLEVLMANSTDIAEKARSTMIKHKLNVFKPETKLDNYHINYDFANMKTVGFNDIDNGEHGPGRWTTGNSVILLPNLYTTTNTIKVDLKCYSPKQDTPIVTLNDGVAPTRANRTKNGYEYFYSFSEQTVIFKASIQNQTVNPQELNSTATDTAARGVIFNSLAFYNYR